jgi:hypothetical protein
LTIAASRFGVALALTVFAAAAALDVRADVVWGQVDRTIYAGTKFQFINPPQPPTYNVNSRTIAGEGPWNESVSNSTGMTNSFAGQNTTISFANNSIVGIGTSSWTNPFAGIGTRQWSYARTEIIASFTVDEPTPYVSDLVLDFNGPSPGGAAAELRSNAGTVISFPLFAPSHQEGVLQPGTWTYTLFAGMPIPTEDTGFMGHGNFDVNFRLVPEPAGLPATVASVALVVGRRRRTR